MYSLTYIDNKGKIIREDSLPYMENNPFAFDLSIRPIHTVRVILTVYNGESEKSFDLAI